jgi:arylformamidase
MLKDQSWWLTADPLFCILSKNMKGQVMERKIFDISMTIEKGMISWPSDGPVMVDRVRSMDDGERLNQSRLDLSAHTGTHIDAPVHFLQGGSGVDSLPLEILIGPAVVVHIPDVRAIGPHQLETANIPPGTDRLLLKTDNGRLLGQSEFSREFSHITPDGAGYLIDHGIRLVGIDYLSVAEYGSGEVVHRGLLGAGIVIVEGVDLREVPAGLYNMIALPLKIGGCDGAPARVVLQEMEEGQGTRDKR